MDELSREYVTAYFSRTLRMHGDRPEALGLSREGQLHRYQDILGTVKNILGKTVLDYGCGKGDFYQFLRENAIPVSYTGLDINGDLISLARSKFPECRFNICDVEKDDLGEDFDYIFLCGVFNLKLKGLDETIRTVLTRLFAHCRHALAFNALSSHTPRKDFELHYVNPEEILLFAQNHLSPYAELKQSSIPHDFILLVRKDR